ncbi:helix-turn-helix domain-containing protein [Chelatococcus sp. GCM10030263]|uniref:helix-turn-helix domain-containing protein n=1 Tax=Chelatococcus sp. GCM10030263 TaxID=3273387 RepID=UPI0036187F1C
MIQVNTIARLGRSARPFEPLLSAERRLLSPVPAARALALGEWQEGSLGDPLHKLLLVVSGQIDLEGASGGWLIVPNHLVFIPADRTFALRASPGTVVQVAHVDPADTEWHHEGCWVTAASPLAREMLAQAVRWSAEDFSRLPVARLFLRTLAHLCAEWFSNPRMLWLPAAHSPEMRAVLTYVRDHLADASLTGACTATGISPRSLQRRCQEELQLGWRQLIREARIMRAMELLTQGRHSVSAVARSIGFRSLGAFTAAFSERVGTVPSEFLRRYGEGARERENRGADWA